MTNSPRTMPWVLVLPPRWKSPWVQSPRIWALNVSMIDWRCASSSGWIRSSARAYRSSLRRLLMRPLKNRVSRSRNSRSKAGRTNGSIRRWAWNSPQREIADRIQHAQAGVGGRDAVAAASPRDHGRRYVAAKSRLKWIRVRLSQYTRPR